MSSLSKARPRSLSGKDTQHIWIYCQQVATANDLLDLCQGIRRMRDSTKVVEPRDIRFQDSLRASILSPPLPYGEADWEEFLADAGALLTASLEHHHRLQRSGAVRWPALLVTDRQKLFQASEAVATKDALRTALAEIVSLTSERLLHVVLSVDFGMLSGQVVSKAPIESRRSLTLQSVPAGLQKEYLLSQHHVKLRHGVFLQRQQQEKAADSSAGSATSAFGARCIALFSDGRGAYSAVSPDGTRGIQASGVWKVINGHVVLSGAGARGVLLSLTSSGESLLSNMAYEEPVHLSLNELAADFEPPLSLISCAPRGGDRLRAELGSCDSDHGEDDEIIEIQSCSSRPESALPLDSTFNSRWEPVISTLDAAMEEASPLEMPKTCTHALLSVACAEACADDTDMYPRLLGTTRVLASYLDLYIADADLSMSRSPLTSPWLPLLDGSADWPANADADMAQEFLSGLLRPGTYSFEEGTLGDYEYQTLRMTLRATGFCEYYEKSGGSVIKSTCSFAIWREEGDLLLLESSKSGSYAFSIQEARGIRICERQVGRVEIPLASIRERCTYAPLTQTSMPFLGHQSLDVEHRILGSIDPDSILVRGLRCRPDRLPYNAFEHEVQRLGLSFDEIISDFDFLDRDHDGQITLADMQFLTTYGNPTAAPEVIEEFRLALVKRYGTLAAAFAAMSAGVPGRMTPDMFEEFLVQQAADLVLPLKKAVSDNEMLKVWVAKTSKEDRGRVFASLNPGNYPAIEWEDFVALNLHSAVLAVRRLAHFQRWVFDEYGRSKDMITRVFRLLDPDSSNALRCRNFCERVYSLGYPCEPATIRSIFIMLDRSFNGELSAKNFQKLRDFDAEQLLKSMVALKRIAEREFGGVDECYNKMQDREKILTASTSSAPRVISFDAFEKVCKSSLLKELPKADLRMLFLFLEEASQHKSADGYINRLEWSILKGLGSRTIVGSPARLRRILETRYGSMEQAFLHMHASWLQRSLQKGLMQLALAGIARIVTERGLSESSSQSKLPALEHAGQGARPRRPPSGVRASLSSLSQDESPSKLPPLARKMECCRSISGAAVVLAGRWLNLLKTLRFLTVPP